MNSVSGTSAGGGGWICDNGGTPVGFLRLVVGWSLEVVRLLSARMEEDTVAQVVVVVVLFSASSSCSVA